MNKRSFPWREDRSPYSVWISEVMLQQTRANVVIPYYLRWMKKFPRVEILAQAPLEQVIKAWEGLGYYSRARNLHRAAREIVLSHSGEIPSELYELEQLPGFGPYTTHAVLNFAFGKKLAPVDGNVKRVLARFFRIKEEIDRPKTVREIQLRAGSLVSQDASLGEALIELGALVCQKAPKCFVCPLKEGCGAFLHDEASELPIKKKPPQTIHIHRAVSVILWEEEVLLSQGKEGEVMADLWQFPYNQSFSMDLELILRLDEVCHYFTKYKAHLQPSVFRTRKRMEFEGYHWIPLKKLDELAFCSGHKKILMQIKTYLGKMAT